MFTERWTALTIFKRFIEATVATDDHTEWPEDCRQIGEKPSVFRV